MYETMSKQISGATTVLNDPATAAAEIDRVLRVMLYESRPVYIGVPTDVAFVPISDKGLSKPLPRSLPPDDASITKDVNSKIRSLLEQASRPIIIVDGGTHLTFQFHSLVLTTIIRCCPPRCPQ
jgi:pyruvate decarboxylase